MDTFRATCNGLPSMKRFILRQPAILPVSTILCDDSRGLGESIVAKLGVNKSVG